MNLNDMKTRIPPTFERRTEPVEEVRLLTNTGVRGYHFILEAVDNQGDSIATSEEGFIHYYFNNRWHVLNGKYDRIKIYKETCENIDKRRLIKDLVKEIKIEDRE